MGVATAVFPAVERTSSILDALEDAWSSKCVLSPPRRVFNSVPDDQEDARDSLSMHFDGFAAQLTKDDEKIRPSSDPARVRSGRGLSWCHSVDETELRAVFRTFDENADGLISTKDLRRFTKVFGIEMSEEDAESMIASATGSRMSRDGGIDFRKFCRLYRTHLVGQDCSREEEVERANEDNDNLVEAFKVFDRNGDGMISADELRTVLLGFGMPEGRSLWRCTKMIQEVASDGNGQCNFSKFKKMMVSRFS